ncbi:hypothetical protein BLNAU_7781 [Blattamonas nauphoetae]|uniref:Uncharacterized protein n=1 Tax=Blattamonas nauphoetae TaxID=2049346 RepID=A0ABQ9Y0B5_9EUKA|nr:hypothetical protein BLNAU_7781 [Blattamonas nauphoetae]
MSEQSYLEDGEIVLPTFLTSDWRLVLQDSITTDDLRQGCISLFDQVDSDLSLSQTEMNHAVRFLKYAKIRIERPRHISDRPIDTIFRTEKDQPKRLATSLINLLSLPSDTLRTAVLSFFDVGLDESSISFTIAVSSTGLMPKLFLILKPHEIPLNDATMEFHRHLTSIMNYFFGYSATLLLENLADPIFQSFCPYIRYLLATPVCPTNHHSCFTLVSTMRKFNASNITFHSRSSSPMVNRFFGEIRKELLDGLASIWGLPSSSEAESYLHSDWRDPEMISPWVEAFESLLAQVSEGKRFSDLEIKAMMKFISRCPERVQLFFWSDDEFGLKVNDTIVSSSKLDSKLLWTLFTPTNPQLSPKILHKLQGFTKRSDINIRMKHVWCGWLPNYINAVAPSKLPISDDFSYFHKNLISTLIVALLDSDSPLDDDTVLRICTFTKKKLNYVNLSEVFRKAGRTTDQYLHALESLLSLHFEFLDRAPIWYLLNVKPHKRQLSFDEWDDVDLATVGVVMRMINQNNLPITSNSNSIIRNFVTRSLPQALRSTARLNQPQLDQLIAPSIDFLVNYLVQPSNYDYRQETENSVDVFVKICELCDQHVIVQCLGRIGFFSRVVTGLLEKSFRISQCLIQLFIRQPTYYGRDIVDPKIFRSAIPCFLEEGWQDALEFIFIQTKDIGHGNTRYGTRLILELFGTNMGRLFKSDGTY